MIIYLLALMSPLVPTLAEVGVRAIAVTFVLAFIWATVIWVRAITGKSRAGRPLSTASAPAASESGP